MRIATLGITLSHSAATRVTGFSDTTLLDFDAVIVDSDGLIHEMTASMAGYKATGRVEANDAQGITFLLGERKRQLNEFLELGRPVIAFCSSISAILVKRPAAD